MGAISIMMMSSTSMTSTRGVTLICELIAPLCAANIHCHGRILLSGAKRANGAEGAVGAGQPTDARHAQRSPRPYAVFLMK